MIFGEVVNGMMVLNDFGKVIEEEWQNSINIRIPWEFPIHITMPNHFHGIVRATKNHTKTTLSATKVARIVYSWF
jgi:hypothetical protein